MVGLGGSFKHHFIRPGQAQAYPESFQFNPTATYPESAASNTDIGKFAYIRLDNNPFATNINKNEITVSFWMYPEKLVNETSLGSENHQIYWVYDPTNNSGNFGRMALHSSAIDWKHRSISVADSGSFNFNQWNHVLMSMKRDDTIVSSGYQGGSWNSTTNRHTAPLQTPNDKIHLVINGVAQHRYVQPNTIINGVVQQDGFFQNDFAIGNDVLFGAVTINTVTTDLFTSNSSEDCYFGTQYNNGYGHDAYKGSIYQFWAKNQYYDLTDANNIALFYNSGASVSSLPSNPIIYFSGGSRISSGSYNPGSSGVYQNRITSSSQTNP
jgi:hypothetical protein